MTDRIPERLDRAVELLDPRPGERILEIGCGPGVAATLICSRLGGEGKLVAIDRSATAIARAAKRNEEAKASGLLDLVETDLAGFAAAEGEFDAALAVNVNVFWTGPAEPELTALGGLLRPGARLLLAYETPGGSLKPRAAEALDANMRRHGFAAEAIAAPPVVGIAARAPAR